MENSFSLINKVILITGASSGIGRQCAISCSQMGAKVVLVARNEERLNKVFAELHGEGHLKFVHDVTNFDGIEAILCEVLEKIGSISGFIHSAGVEITKPFSTTKPSEYANVFNTNVVAGFEFARVISKKKFVNTEVCSFVFISSVLALKGQSALTAYAATKGALVSGVKSMSVELAPKKIRVNCISPGWIAGTAMTGEIEYGAENLNLNYPLGFGKPEDVANACIYIISDASKWVTGINLIVDGGYTAC